MKIKLHSWYEHFPHHKVDRPDEPYIDCYNDIFCMREKIVPNSIALLIEPRSIQPDVYRWMEQNYRKFKYVFTHDSLLLNHCDNAKLILWGGGCGGIAEYHPTGTKLNKVSLVSSNKEMCELHKARVELARQLKGNPKVDVMGTIDGGEFVGADKIYPDYKFSIAFENYIDDYWFTEKICNCFANKTVPIYYGANAINNFFNPWGIIWVDDWKQIPQMIDKLDLDFAYETRLDAIEDNYRIVHKYAVFEDWFFREYEELLNDLHS